MVIRQHNFKKGRKRGYLPTVLLILIVLEILISILSVVELVKANSFEPTVVWSRIYGGSEFELGTSLIQTIDGGYALLGDTNSYGAGEYDLWLVKTDCEGHQVWTKTYGGEDTEVTNHTNSLQQTSDGGFIILGRTESFGMGSSDILLIKTDAAGTMEWNKTFGSGNWEEAYSVFQTSDGGYAIAGFTGSPLSGYTQIYIIKTDAFGNKLWDKTYDVRDLDYATDIIELTDGYIVVGNTATWAGPGGTWLAKLDISGNLEWNKIYEDGFARSIIETSDGYLIVGDKSANFWLIKIDYLGNTQWEKTFGGPKRDYALSAIIDDNEFIIAGYTSSFGAGDTDMWIIKTDSFGNMLWNITYGGSEEDIGCSIVKVKDREYAIAGYTSSFGAENLDLWLVKLMELDTTPPEIVILSPQNVTYATNFVPLSFTVDEATSWIGYNLDNQANVTITGNTTLTDLAEGLHTIIVYGNDTSGNMGISDTVYFTIALPYGPKAEFTATPETAKVGEIVKFDASTSQPGWNGTHTMPITEYQWDFGDGNKTTTTAPTIYHSYKTAGNYYVILTVYAPGATPETDTITHRVTIVSVPVGGYSIPIQVRTKAEPTIPYITLTVILTAIFIAAKRKTKRKH